MRLINMKNLKEIKEIVIPILKKWDVKKASIFGSQVRGEAIEDSDVDILVELKDDLDIFDFIELKLELESALNKKVDLVEYQMIKPALKEYILKEQVLII